MAVPTRDVPLASVRQTLEARLRSSLAANSAEGAPAAADESALQSFVDTFDGALRAALECLGP